MHLKKDSLNDTGSERAVLSALCQFGKNAYIDIADIIKTCTFTLESNQAIFKCLESIFQESDIVDAATLIAKGEQLNLSYLVSKTQGDIEYLRALFSFPIKLENARIHAKRIAKLEIIRLAQQKHIEACEDLGNLDGSETIDKILGISEKPIFDLTISLAHNKENQLTKLGDASDNYLKNVSLNKNKNIGIPTPFSVWNAAVGGGIRRGGVSLICARPKARKSTAAIVIGLHVCNLGIPVLYLDTEMLPDDQIPRILANLSGVSIGQIEDGNYEDNALLSTRVKEANNRFKQMPFCHLPIFGKRFDEILSLIRRWIFKSVGFSNGRTNNCLVIYDYFKIMSTEDLNDMPEYQAIGHQVSKLADFAKECDFPCLAFTQVNRDGITKETSDIISQSDRLAWLCTSISLLKRKEPEEILEDGRENGNMKLLILDNMCRYGPGLETGDYINILSTGDTFILKELGTKLHHVKDKLSAGLDLGNQIEF